MKDLCQEWNVKLIFWGAWNSWYLDLIYPDLCPLFYDRCTPLEESAYLRRGFIQSRVSFKKVWDWDTRQEPNQERAIGAMLPSEKAYTNEVILDALDDDDDDDDDEWDGKYSLHLSVMTILEIKTKWPFNCVRSISETK